VILLGDDLHDVEMIEGFDYNNLIKIGFLNERWDELLPVYQQNYDLIIPGDQGMEPINAILARIFDNL
jgi:5'-nucleotidase